MDIRRIIGYSSIGIVSALILYFVAAIVWILYT